MYLVRVREKIAPCSPILQSGRNSNSIFDVVNLRLLPAFISVRVGTPLHDPVRDDSGRAPLEGPDACTTEVILELILPTSESSELRGVQLILYHIPNEPSFAGMKTHPIVQNYTVLK